jgi:hypothetical protein
VLIHEWSVWAVHVLAMGVSIYSASYSFINQIQAGRKNNPRFISSKDQLSSTNSSVNLLMFLVAADTPLITMKIERFS